MGQKQEMVQNHTNALLSPSARKQGGSACVFWAWLTALLPVLAVVHCLLLRRINAMSCMWCITNISMWFRMMLSTDEEGCAQVFTPRNGHPHTAWAQRAERGEYGCGSHHHQTQHHSTLWYIEFRVDGKTCQLLRGWSPSFMSYLLLNFLTLLVFCKTKLWLKWEFLIL